MSHNSKALGLATLVALVAGALLASTAHAETPMFKGGTGLARETGTQEAGKPITIGVNAGSLECNEANLLDNSGNGGMMLVMEPSFTKCALSGVSATVKVNGCKYTFEPTATTIEDSYSGRMGILCTGANLIEISNGKCLITIGEQISLQTVEFVNNTAAEPVKDETWRTEVSKGKYMQTGECAGGTGVFENMTISGSETIKGENAGGEPVALWIE
jgi:hypothetical protein